MNTTGKKFGGRKKGSTNKTTPEAKAIIQKIITDELAFLPLYLDSLTIQHRVEALIKLLPYVMPKQSHIELDAQLTSYQFTPVTIIANEPIKIQSNEAEN